MDGKQRKREAVRAEEPVDGIPFGEKIWLKIIDR
jgi:hypothetical protein